MKLAFADIRNMTISPLNMHFGRPKPDTSDIAGSIRQRGILLTMLVRETLKDGAVVEGHYEVVAGARRLYAAQDALAAGIEIDPAPVGILDPGDDAAAIEASLIENLQRLPPDEVSCWETFVKLIKEGRTPEQIGATFTMSDTVVRRTLALGNLLPRLRNLYRREEIDVASIRFLTLASKTQQKAWLALFDDPAERAPTGHQLKTWLFGGGAIPTSVALFSLDDYPGQIKADLFGEESYFADVEVFWAAQNAAIAARRDALLAEGWSAVEVMEQGAIFQSWNHTRWPKDQGGKVFIAVTARGEVTVHQGWLTHQAATRAARAQVEGEGTDIPRTERGEVTSAAQAYIDLHRHAAVRLALAEHPKIALRLLVAHLIAGGPYVQVEADPRRAPGQAVADSVQASPALALFEAKRAGARKLLGDDGETGQALVGRRRKGGAAAIFARLLALDDAQVLEVAAVVMGEALASGGVEVEAAGAFLQVEIGATWTPDETFLELIKDREALNAMLKEVGGRKVADGNVGEKLKTQRGILRNFLEGSDGRPEVKGWTPKWMSFPASGYTKKPFPTGDRGKTALALLRKTRPGKAAQPAPVAPIQAPDPSGVTVQ